MTEQKDRAFYKIKPDILPITTHLKIVIEENCHWTPNVTKTIHRRIRIFVRAAEHYTTPKAAVAELRGKTIVKPDDSDFRSSL